MSPDFWFLVVDVANVLCVGLLGVRVLMLRPAQRNAQLVALICLCAVCYYVLARDDYGFWIAEPYRISVGAWRPWLNLGRNLSPGLLMILVHRLFVDRGRLPRWLLAAFALQIFLEEPIKWLVPAARQSLLIGQVAPTLLETLFAGLALYWTLADWRADLVEARRRGRMLVTAVLLINVVASSLLLRVADPARTPWPTIRPTECSSSAT